MEGWTDPVLQDPSSFRQGLTSTTAVDWHLKAKNKKCNVGLIKNDQHAKNQLNP